MQNDQGISTAQKRVGEMNRLMQGYLEQGNRYIQQRNMQSGRNMQNMAKNVQAPPPPVQPRFENIQRPQNPQSIQRQNIPEAPPDRVPPDEPQKNQSGGFNADNLLIIILAAVLMRENADIRLILALLYILV